MGKNSAVIMIRTFEFRKSPVVQQGNVR